MARTRDGYHYTFIHNVFGGFIEDTLSYFADYMYPRTNYRVVGTYDKAVDYLKEQMNLGREMDMPNLTSMILNPSGDFNLDEANSGAKQLYRFPNLNSGFIQRLYEPIYKDANTQINVGFTRLRGEFELLILVNSFYEYFDVKLLMMQYFGGEGRIITPVYFNSFIIIPDELKNFRYENDETGVSYGLDWDSAGAYDHLVRTTNRNELVIAGKIKPRYILRGISDASARHGGLDSLADWRLSLTIEYELEIPSFIIIDSDYIAEGIVTNFRYGHTYSEYPDYNEAPDAKDSIDTVWDSGLQDGISDTVPPDLPDEVDAITKTERQFKIRYFHEITTQEADATSVVFIDLPEPITDQTLLIVQNSEGRLEYGDDYTIENSGNILSISSDVILKEGEFLELYVYEVVV